MPKNINSASRLLRVLEQHTSCADGVQTLDAWAALLGVNEQNQHRRAIAVGELVHAMNRELHYASASLANANFSAHLYESAFSKIEHALSPMLLPSTWNQVRQYLTPDVLTALAFCTEILPNEEAEVSTDELSTIRNKLDELRETLQDSSMPPRLRSLIKHHVGLIEKALFEYPIVGANALREAGRTALGEMIEAQEEIGAAKGDASVSKLESAWKAVNQAADIALKAEGIAQLGQKAWDMISNFL